MKICLPQHYIVLELLPSILLILHHPCLDWRHIVHLTGPQMAGSSVGIASVDDKDNPLEKIYERILELNLNETPVSNSSTAAPTQAKYMTSTHQPVLVQDSLAEATLHQTDPNGNINSKQFELSIKDEIQNMESLTFHDKSMLTLIIHCNRKKAPKGIFDSFLALLKKEIKSNKFNILRADTRDTFIARMRKQFPCSVPTFVDIPIGIPSDIIPNSLTSFPTL
jgi:hypothetical protein